MDVSKYIPIYITYQCSKCGKVISTAHVVRDVITAANGDTIIWQGKKEDFNDNLNGKNEIETGRRIKKIYAEREKGLYRLAEFNCKCKNCNHREPWARMRYYKYDAIFGSALPFGILLTIVAFPVGIWILGAVALYLLIKHLHRYFIEKKIDKLPALSLPYFSVLPQEPIELFKNKLNEVKAKEKINCTNTSPQNSEELSEKEKAKRFGKEEYNEIIKYWGQLYCVTENKDLDEDIVEQVVSGLWQNIEIEKGDSFSRKLKVFISYINEDKLAEELDIVNCFYSGDLNK